MSRILAQLKKSSAICRTAVRTKADGHHSTYKPLTMDDMPVPTIPWKEYYGKQNSKYNLILAGGFISFVASIYILQDNVFFNAFVPPYPFEDDKKE